MDFHDVAKGQEISKANNDFLDSSKKQTKLTILSTEGHQDSEFCLFFRIIKDTMNLLFEIY